MANAKKVLDVYVNKKWHRSFDHWHQVDGFVAAWFNSPRSTDSDEIEVKTVYRRYYCE